MLTVIRLDINHCNLLNPLWNQTDHKYLWSYATTPQYIFMVGLGAPLYRH